MATSTALPCGAWYGALTLLVRAHGRDERIRAKDFFDGLTFYDLFVKALVE